MAIAKEDMLQWQVLAILGFKISGYCLKTHEKYVSYLIRFLSILVLLHWILASLCGILKLTYISELVYILMPVQIILLWYFLNAENETWRYIIRKMYMYRNRYCNGISHSRLLNSIIITMILFPVTISLVIATLTTKLRSTSWSFGYKINNDIFVQIAIFYTSFIYYSGTTFTAFLTFSLSIIFYRWGTVLSGYSKLLEMHLKEKKFYKIVEFLKDIFNIMKILQKLQKVLAYPTLILICVSLEMIFRLFYDTLLQKELLIQARFFTRVIFNGLCGFLIMVLYCISSSMIPEQLTEIKKTATHYLNKYGDNISIP